MKKIFYIVLTILCIVSCDKNFIGDFETETSVIVDTKVDKKGADISYKTKDWSHRTSYTASHWFYHWGNTPREEIPENVEYVPMFWGKSGVTDSEIERLKQLKAEGKIQYVLGFNEPDGSDQANMTVDEAIALWPKLEEIGLPLGSPATKNPLNSWMKEFMQKADENNLRIDFITVHHYGGTNALSLINRLKDTYKAYGNRPIWITEFAVADWSATKPEANKYSKEEVLQFMTEVLPELDKIEWVHRYSWFNGSKPQLITSALFDEDSNPTELGAYYAAHSPNMEIGPGTDTEFVPPIDDDELMNNGHFEGGTWEKVDWATWNMPNGWDGYNSDVVGIETTGAFTGNYCARLKNSSSALEVVVDVEGGKTYTYKLATKWAEDNGLVQKIVFKDHIANSKITASTAFPSTTEWSETTGEITIPAGTSKLRFVFWNDKGTHFYFDDVSLKEKK